MARMAAPALVLASGSPRRQALLQRLGLEFEVRAAEVDESPIPGEAPGDYALRLACEKAAAVARTIPAGLVVGADTIVVDGGEVLGKPADAAEARRTLERLRGHRHLVATAVAVVDARSGETASAVEWTAVWMRPYGDEEIAAYVATGDAQDKAGAYAIQHPAFRPVAALQGSETNVIGLPLARVRWLLARVGRPVA